MEWVALSLVVGSLSVILVYVLCTLSQRSALAGIQSEVEEELACMARKAEALDQQFVEEVLKGGKFLEATSRYQQERSRMLSSALGGCSWRWGPEELSAWAKAERELREGQVLRRGFATTVTAVLVALVATITVALVLWKQVGSVKTVTTYRSGVVKRS